MRPETRQRKLVKQKVRVCSDPEGWQHLVAPASRRRLFYERFFTANFWKIRE
jgi:hypothetical protein